MSQDQQTPTNRALVEATLERSYSASGRDMDYAQQLITMLEKKNRSLSILWPVLLIVALGLAFACFTFYQQNVMTQKELADSEKELDEQQSANTELKNQRDRNTTRQAEVGRALLKTLKTPHAWLDTENDAVLAQITVLTPGDDAQVMVNLVDQILARADKTFELQRTEVERLQAQVLKVESEANNTKVAYSALQERVKEQTSELTSTMEKIDSLAANRDKNLLNIQQQLEAFKQENVRLQKDVNKRVDAFEALAKRYKGTQQQNRELSEKLASKENNVKSLEKQLKIAEVTSQQSAKRLNELQHTYTTLKDQYDSLNKSLKAITQPIAPNPTAPKPVSVAPNLTSTPPAASEADPPPASSGAGIQYPDAQLK